MKKRISKVTVTGADDTVRTDDLVLLAKRFPFVEFGLLVSQSGFGRPRFPSRSWFTDLKEVADGSKVDLNISGHICGRWVQQAFQGVFPYSDIPAPLLKMAKRWQLNTHGEAHPCDPEAFFEMIQMLNDYGQEVIFQYDGQNSPAISLAVNNGLKVSALFDMSHGAGVLPGSWPVMQDVAGGLLACPWGFAGGLSPENVAAQIELMPERSDGDPIWIDAETKLRSAEAYTFDNFDLKKVEAFLEAAQPWVIE